MTPELELVDGVLKVNKELDYDYDVSFDRACNSLVASPQTELVIDLSRIRHITSTYIGMMAAAYIRAQSNGKKLSIIAEGQVFKVLILAGFANLMKVTDSGRFKARSAEPV